MRMLIALGILFALAGLFTASQATLGVALIGLACFLGIMARIAQASAKSIAGSVHTARTPEAAVPADSLAHRT